MNKRKVIFICVAVLAVVGVGGWLFRGEDANAATPYRTGEIRIGTVESTVSSTGTLAAVRSVAVGTQVSGRVTELHADYNDRVRRGQLLARIDPTLQRQAVRNSEANLERVRAALAQAEREYQRNRTLYEQQVITETEYNQIEYNLTVARSNVTSAEVSLEQARQNLAYTEIYAPIDGVVVERNVEPGQTVAASMSAPQLYLLASDLREMEILSQVDESDIGDIQNGMPVRFTVSAYPNETFQGVVRQVRLSSSTQNNVVNYTAVISVDNPTGRLLPGMTANVDFIAQRAENVMMVPNAALRFRPTEEMISSLTDSAMIVLARSNGAPTGRRGAGDAAAPQGGGAAGQNGGAPAVNAMAPSQNDRTPAADAALAPGQGRAAGPGAGGARQARPGAAQPVSERGETPAPAAAPEAAGNLGAFVVGGQAAPGQPRGGVATVWYLKDGKLGVARVRTGISDGTNTEISGLEHQEGMQIVTGLNQAQTSSGPTNNPFQQQPQGFGGPGGGGPPPNFGGGGGGGGGGR